MNSDRTPKYFRPSLLDRLLRADADGGGPQQAPGRDDPFRLQNIHEFMASLCRDLEDLLNTRSSASDVPRWAKGCATSILNYGLPDRVFDSDPATAARMVRDTIATFETRLCDVRVEPLGGESQRFDRARLEIRARLIGERGTAIRLWVQLRSSGVGQINLTVPE